MTDLLYGRLFMFQSLIYFEEVHHFVEHVVGQFVDVVIIVIRGVFERNGDDFFVQRTAVYHLDDADRIAIDEGHGINRFPAEHQDVQRIAVFRQRAGNETVIGGIYSRGIQDSVQLQKPRFLIEFVLRLAAFGNFDKRFETARGDPLFGNIVPDVHNFSLPYSELF